MISNYLKRITLSFDSYEEYVNPMAIGVNAPRIDSGCSLDKEFTELIDINPRMILYLTVN